MKFHGITFIAIGYFERKLLDTVADSVAREYDCPVELMEHFKDLSPFFDPARKQYNGNSLLKDIDHEFATDERKTIALVTVDLFIPILTYIFGQAYLNGRAGIASMYRLSNERYGLPRDEQLLALRCAKEVIHELGHSFGLIHCHNLRCVMQSSTYVEDIDQKMVHLCNDCRKKLGLEV